MDRFLAMWVLLAALSAASSAQATDIWLQGPGAFDGLIPGEPVEEELLYSIYGRGAVTVQFNLPEGSFEIDGDLQLNNNGTSTDVISTSSELIDNSGIVQSVPVTGDGNVVDVSVSIIINMNTVTVMDSEGANISVIQTLDASGSITAFDPFDP